MLLTQVGLIGIVSLFLPFSFGVSPVKAIHDPYFWRMAAPAFLAVFISYASMRLIVSGLLSGAEKAIAYIVSTASACVTISFSYVFIRENEPLTDFWTISTWVIPLIVLRSRHLKPFQARCETDDFRFCKILPQSWPETPQGGG